MNEQNDVSVAQEVRPSGYTALWCGLVAVLLLGAVGCGDPNAQIYVDNGGDQEMSVKVSGQTGDQNIVVPAGKFESISLPPGDYRFIVDRGGESLYNGMRTLEKSGTIAYGKQYMWNPGREFGYASCKIEYGSQAFSNFTKDVMVKWKEAESGQEADPVRVEFTELKEYAQPMPASEWFEIPKGIQYVLKDAPEYVHTRTGSSTRRALTRVPLGVHTMLQQAHSVENPTANDVDVLALATEMAMDTLSELERSK